MKHHSISYRMEQSQHIGTSPPQPPPSAVAPRKKAGTTADHAVTPETETINRWVSFFPLLCVLQAPCGRSLLPFSYGSRARPFSDASWADMFWPFALPPFGKPSVNAEAWNSPAADFGGRRHRRIQPKAYSCIIAHSTRKCQYEFWKWKWFFCLKTGFFITEFSTHCVKLCGIPQNISII